MAVNDCFTIGAIVLCTTCFNEEVEGEVLAFDYNTKMLVLKCTSKNSEKLNDVYMLNLSYCSNVKVIKECNGNLVEEPQKLNLEQLTLRIRKTIQQRQTYLHSRNADVSSEAQELYRAIAKQFKYNEVSWKGSNIEIFKEVTISPPYSVDDVKSSSNNQTLCNYIKKMIEQFLNARSGSENTTTTSTHSSSSSSSLGMVKSSSNATSISPVPAN